MHECVCTEAERERPSPAACKSMHGDNMYECRDLGLCVSEQFPSPKAFSSGSPPTIFSHRDLINTPDCRESAGTETLIGEKRMRWRKAQGWQWYIHYIFYNCCKYSDKARKMSCLQNILYFHSTLSHGWVLARTTLKKSKVKMQNVSKLFLTAVETRSERKKRERERQRGTAYEIDTDLAQCPIHNEQCPTPAQLQHTIPHKRDWGRLGRDKGEWPH